MEAFIMELIKMTNISKYFHHVVALDGVDFYE